MKKIAADNNYRIFKRAESTWERDECPPITQHRINEAFSWIDEIIDHPHVQALEDVDSQGQRVHTNLSTVWGILNQLKKQ